GERCRPAIPRPRPVRSRPAAAAWAQTAFPVTARSLAPCRTGRATTTNRASETGPEPATKPRSAWHTDILPRGVSPEIRGVICVGEEKYRLARRLQPSTHATGSTPAGDRPCARPTQPPPRNPQIYRCCRVPGGVLPAFPLARNRESANHSRVFP